MGLRASWGHHSPSEGHFRSRSLMYAVGDRVILAAEPLVGEAGTVWRIWEGTAAVLLDARGPLGWPIIALVDLEEPQKGLDSHP